MFACNTARRRVIRQDQVVIKKKPPSYYDVAKTPPTPGSWICAADHGPQKRQNAEAIATRPSAENNELRSSGTSTPHRPDFRRRCDDDLTRPKCYDDDDDNSNNNDVDSDTRTVVSVSQPASPIGQFRRLDRLRSSLPVVGTVNKSMERPLGLSCPWLHQ